MGYVEMGNSELVKEYNSVQETLDDLNNPVKLSNRLPLKPNSRVEIMLTRLNNVSNSPRKVCSYIEARIPKQGVIFTRNRRKCNSIYDSLIYYASTFPKYLIVLPELNVLCYQIAFTKNMTKRRAKNILFKYYKAKCKSLISNYIQGNQEVLC